MESSTGGLERVASREVDGTAALEIAECDRLIPARGTLELLELEASCCVLRAFARNRASSVRRTCSGVIGFGGREPEWDGRGGGVDAFSAIVNEEGQMDGRRGLSLPQCSVPILLMRSRG